MYIINKRRSVAYVYDKVVHDYLKQYAFFVNRSITSLILEGIEKYGDGYFYVPIVQKKYYNSIKLFPNQHVMILNRYCYPKSAEFSSFIRYVIFSIMMNTVYSDKIRQFYSRYPCLFEHKF